MWGSDFSAGGKMNSPELRKMLPELSLPKHNKRSGTSVQKQIEIRQILSQSRLRCQVRRRQLSDFNSSVNKRWTTQWVWFSWVLQMSAAQLAKVLAWCLNENEILCLYPQHMTKVQSVCKGYTHRFTRSSSRRVRSFIMKYNSEATVNGSKPLKKRSSSSWRTISVH